MAKISSVLEARDLAGKISGKKDVRWYLTEKGRRMTVRQVQVQVQV